MLIFLFSSRSKRLHYSQNGRARYFSQNYHLNKVGGTFIRLIYCLLDSTVQPKPSAQANQAILTAAENFSKCIQTQSENAKKAWNSLYAVFEGTSANLQLKDGDGTGVGKSVWDIEQSLQNMEQFLGVVDEVCFPCSTQFSNSVDKSLFSILVDV